MHTLWQSNPSLPDLHKASPTFQFTAMLESPQVKFFLLHWRCLIKNNLMTAQFESPNKPTPHFPSLLPITLTGHRLQGDKKQSAFACKTSSYKSILLQILLCNSIELGFTNLKSI